MRILAILATGSLTLLLSAPAAGGDPPGATGPAEASAAPTPDELLALWKRDQRSPLEYVVAKFSGAKWVFLGEYHRVKHDVDLVVSLIPALHERTAVRHLALEFLCRDRTQEANRLVSAERYDRERAIAFFRDQFPSWSYEEYLGIFESAWRSNRRWKQERGPFRLVGLHPCIDWELVHYGTDPEEVAREKDKQKRYDEIMAEELERAVLRPGHPALIFTGIAHATGKFPEYWVGTEEQLPRMGNLVFRPPYRANMFFIALHAPFYDSGTNRDIYPFDGVLDRLMARFGRDIGFDVVGTPFADLVHQQRSPRSITAFRFGELYDGYIIFRTPIREYVGVTCIDDWLPDEAAFRYFHRHLSNREASESIAAVPFEEFRADFCAPRPSHGVEFRRRFRRLPELTAQPQGTAGP